MLTLKIPYQCQDEAFQDTLLELRTIQSSFIRSAYQLFHEGMKQSEVQKDKALHEKFQLGSWLKQSGLIEAKAIQERNGERKVIFGGKKTFYERAKGKITKEEWKNKRLSALYSIGEACKNGNRLFKLDIENSLIIFKPSRGTRYKLELPSLRRNWETKLKILQARAELKEQPYTVRLDDKFIYLTFEEEKGPRTKPIENRFIGIDLNPESIGVSVIQNSSKGIKVLYTQEYSVSKIVNEIKELKVASTDKKLKHLHNKLNFETIEIAKDIERLAISWNCKGVFIEDLSFKGDAGLGKRFNRLTKNLWKRETLSLNLEKRCKLSGLTFYKASPQHSSIIGNLMYEYSDPVNASIEIARRGVQAIFEKNKKYRKFYPDFVTSQLKDQWKELFSDCKDWKEVFLKLKNSGLKYRVSRTEVKFRKVFELNSFKSRVKVYNFC